MTAGTPAQAAAHAFVTGCVARGITASNAAAPGEGQLDTVRRLWADVARDTVAAYIEANGADPVDAASVIAEAIVPELAAVTAERDALRLRTEAAEAAKGAARAELAALEGRLSLAITAAVQAEQARAAAADEKLAGVRGTVAGFLRQYGNSRIPVFKVAQDLASSILKILDGTREAEVLALRSSGEGGGAG